MHKVFLISYDLEWNDPEPEIHFKIKSLADECHHCLKSTWIIAVQERKEKTIDVEYLTDELLKSLKAEEDSLLVANVTESDMQGFLPKETWEWIDHYQNQ